jgi:glycosyltransferase involved in cell wall biosynthesis
MRHMPTTLDIILPCYNPPSVDWARQLPPAVQAIQSQLGPEVEITLILVNDGSKPGVIKEEDISWLQRHLPRFHYITYQPNHGKGHALRQGVAIAQSTYQIYTDIDFPYTTASFAAVFQALTQGKDIAAGVRDHRYYEHVPPLRRFISKVLRWMLRTFLRTKIADTQCGLKGFNAQGRKVFLETRIERFLFDLEFIFLASNQPDVRIQAVEVELKPGVEFSRARMGILLRESVNFFSIFWRGVWRRLKG